MITTAVWLAEFVATPAAVVGVTEALHDLLVRTNVAVAVAIFAVPAVLAAALRGSVASATSYAVATALDIVPFDAETEPPTIWIKAEMKSYWLNQ